MACAQSARVYRLRCRRGRGIAPAQPATDGVDIQPVPAQLLTRRRGQNGNIPAVSLGPLGVVVDVPTFDAAFDIKPALQNRAERGFIKRFETRTA